MTKESALKCIENGRIDLVEHMFIKSLGYAGVLCNGNVCDRRKYPKAVAMQKNSMLNIPEPRHVDYIIGMLKRCPMVSNNIGDTIKFCTPVTAKVIGTKVISTRIEPLLTVFEFVYDDYCKVNLWKFKNQVGEITLNEWIEQLKD